MHLQQAAFPGVFLKDAAAQTLSPSTHAGTQTVGGGSSGDDRRPQEGFPTTTARPHLGA